jgi:hypothetical protein
VSGSQQTEIDPGRWHLELVPCPECGAEGLRRRRCTNCGYVFPVEEGAEPVPEVAVPDESDEGEEKTFLVKEGQQEEEVVVREQARATPDVMEELAKSLRMQVWAVGMLQEGKVSEVQFGRLYDSYLRRLRPYVDRRNMMLEAVNYLEPIEADLKEATLRLEELEMRRSIKDASDEEYRVKVPAVEWDIRRNEEELMKRREEISYLEDLKSVLTEAEIADLKEKAARCIEMMEGEDPQWEASKGTTNRVKEALKGVEECLEGFGHSLTE